MTEPHFPPPSTEPQLRWDYQSGTWTAEPAPNAGPLPTFEQVVPSEEFATAPAVRPARSRRTPVRDVALIFGAAILSAAVASGATVALVPRPVAVTVSAPAPAADATPATAATVSADTSSSIAGIAAADSPAVVTIQTTVTTQGSGRRAFGGGGFGGGTGEAVGSGFIYKADGYILTAAHVVEGATSIKVILPDGRTFDGTVASSDTKLDVAVVKIAATGLPTVAIGSSASLQIGQTVVAIGDPLGQYPGSVTIGIVSGLDRSLTVADDVTGQPRDLTGMLQTDAAINQGNSGGPVLDANGRAIGIVSAGSSSAQGIGFAVPIDAAATVIAKAASS